MHSASLVLPPQCQAILALPEDERYRYFLRQAVSSARVWGLLDPRGWLTLTDAQGRTGLPVWPLPVYAAACARGAWADYEPACIELPALLDHWLPDMAELGVVLDVFPVTGRPELRVAALQLALALREQLALSRHSYIDAGRSTAGTRTGHP